jgi:hypothetical protein
MRKMSTFRRNIKLSKTVDRLNREIDTLDCDISDRLASAIEVVLKESHFANYFKCNIIEDKIILINMLRNSIGIPRFSNSISTDFMIEVCKIYYNISVIRAENMWNLLKTNQYSDWEYIITTGKFTGWVINIESKLNQVIVYLNINIEYMTQVNWDNPIDGWYRLRHFVNENINNDRLISKLKSDIWGLDPQDISTDMMEKYNAIKEIFE